MMAEPLDTIRNGAGTAWWQDETGVPIRRLTHAEQLRSLVELLDSAIAEQPRADEIVAACGEDAPVPLAYTRDGARLQIAFYRLRLRLDGLDLDAELEDVRERAGTLLLYHQRCLQEALAVAFSPHLTPAGRLRCRINGLGAPATRLRELRDRLRSR